MGLASSPAEADDSESLHHNAEVALITAITEKTDFSSFRPDQRERSGKLLQLESELDRAIDNKTFELHYQPKVNAGDFSPCGAEALLRWNTERYGAVSPEVFIPLADRPGRIEPLTSFVLSTAIRQALDWPCKLPVSVNISTGMLLNSELTELVGNALGMWDFEPQRLCLEVTEGALMSDPEASQAVLRSLRELGVQFSIDDFGTGYSSLAYFKNIPANELKIDKSFVLNLLQDEGDNRIVNAVVQLSKGFGMEVTAEGVEDKETALLLAQLGCDYLQGFYFARPMPHKDLLSWLAQQQTKISQSIR
jgi:EAL domain-containing protein (putative c-di-GMP-specific phosphodiesterase class I)